MFLRALSSFRGALPKCVCWHFSFRSPRVDDAMVSPLQATMLCFPQHDHEVSKAQSHEPVG